MDCQKRKDVWLGRLTSECKRKPNEAEAEQLLTDLKNVKEVRMFELVPSLYMRSLFEDLNFELSDFNKATDYLT